MGQTERVRAISLMKNIVYFIVSLIGTVYISFWADLRSEPKLVLLLIILVIIICFAAYHLIHTVYLTEYGIECYRIGKKYRKLPWKQIAQVNIVRDLQWSARVSNAPRIIITPVGCEDYSKDWSVIKYLFLHRHQVICIDYSKKNLAFIKQHYGEIIDYVYKDANKKA